MAIVCVDLESTLPSWYTTAVYSAATTYAQNDYVIAAAASGLYSGTTAVLWKSLQNGNTGNALEEGVWWTVVADGSAAKPYKSLDDATRFAASGANDIRVKAGADHTTLSDSYTFYCVGTYAGKCIKTGSTDTINVGDFIGDDTMGFFRVRGISGTDPYILDIGTTTAGYMFWHTTELDVTPTTCYKANPISLQGSQEPRTGGSDNNNRLSISCGWDAAFSSQNTLKRTYMTGSAYSIAHGGGSGSYTTWDGICLLGGERFFLQKSNVVVNNVMVCMPGNSTLIAYNGGNTKITNSIFIGGGLDGGSTGYIYGENNLVLMGGGGGENCYHKNSTFAKGGNTDYSTTRADVYRFDNCKFGKVNSTNVGVFYNNTGVEKPFVICNSCTFVDTLLKSTLVNLISMNHQGVSSDHRHYFREGNIFADSTTRYTASGLAWRFEPNAFASQNYPLEFISSPNPCNNDPFAVAVAASSQVTATIWCKKSDADSAFEAQFICKGGQLAGITNDVKAVAADSTDWQQLTIQVTSTETGVLRFGFQVWGSKTATCHIDDFGVSQ